MPILAWAVEYSVSANDQLGKLDRRISNRIVSCMEDGVARLENPRLRGQALTGNLRGLWRYRVGNYRVVCDIQDEVLRVLVVEVGHRGQVYR